jgi:hypothetical protein
MPRPHNSRRARTPQRGAALFEQSHYRDDALLFFHRLTVPPDAELVRELDVPIHNFIMHSNAYSGKKKYALERIIHFGARIRSAHFMETFPYAAGTRAVTTTAESGETVSRSGSRQGLEAHGTEPPESVYAWPAADPANGNNRTLLLSLTDCVSMQTMRAEGLTLASHE